MELSSTGLEVTDVVPAAWQHIHNSACVMVAAEESNQQAIRQQSMSGLCARVHEFRLTGGHGLEQVGVMKGNELLQLPQHR